MQESIKVFAPATVANVGCGFDIMGFALDGIGEEIIIRKTETNALTVLPVRGFEDIPTDPEKNVATVAVKAMLERLSVTQGFEFEFIKHIKPGSGLGTSASSSAGAVFGVNEMLGRPFEKKDLVEFAMEGEKLLSGKAHGDNVSPSLLGGFQLIRGYNPLDLVNVSFPENLYVTIVHPQVEIKTSEARKMLRTEIPMSEAVTQWGNVGGLVAGLYTSDLDLIGRSMQDVIVEPIRSKLIPKFDEVKAASLAVGGVGCSIAGSGPSIFTFSKDEETAQEIKLKMTEIYSEAGIEVILYISKIGKTGARIID
ncbi:homoserine kinase [Reichenbachiella sp. MALMAid0571]|uniref:homoserine kinase n=1 Tax=Reichenbachiella sp. MALMAid0571 TaxID=3143939 RepID=UPI0032DE9DAE